ncbi:histidine phosphatase family protein [Pseudomonas sp. GV071]|uniref:histidine phosphatase family protein n=1 Tax=Pseudomonas sp. GV071 TaxID=2135754 RepID=UPI000D3D2042|nr:histidine phosphatase family protein [Pseudomonas sp. GV071]PTQ74109.1 broad specificity phosphatase PhoE [Pseudomonas sp. GV071]
MKATRLTLIAHARTPAQKLGRLADDEAIEDVAAELISALQVRAGERQGVLCGPELRTRQTAALLVNDLVLEPALADCDLAAWRGLSLKDLQEQQADALQQWLNDSAAAPHGGESLDALGARVGAWLEGFRQPGHWLAVTHPFVIRAALAHVLHCSPADAQQIDVEPLAMVELSHYGKWRLRL